MKTIIDENGEVVEVETENEIAERKLYEVGAIDQKTFEEIEMYLYYEDRYKTIKYKIEEAMKANGIKKWDNDYFVATIKDGSMQNRPDVEKMKADGIYNDYTKLIPVKGGLQIRFKDQRKS